MKYKVMLADDELIMRKALQTLIEWPAMECEVVSVVENGREVLSYLKENKVDILVTDIKMPGADGIEIAKYIWENGMNTKVILLTAYADFSYAQSAIKYNVVEYVLKTGDFAELLQAIERCKTFFSAHPHRTEEALFVNEDAKQKLVNKSLEYIEHHFCDAISVAEIAENLGTSVSYLSRIFKESTGKTLIHTINHKKLEKAKFYLTETDRKVYEVADALGFENITYFSRFFKKHTGISPKDYKESLKK